MDQLVEIQLSKHTRVPEVLKHNLKINFNVNFERTPLQDGVYRTKKRENWQGLPAYIMLRSLQKK